MGQHKKEYIGGIKSEEEAGRVYDEMAIRTHGTKVNP
jgi:hypothetical protein